MDNATRSQLPSLRTRLLQRLVALQSEINAAETAQRRESGLASDVRDQKDLAAETQTVGLDEAQLQRDLDEAAEVRSALNRLDGARYGDCVDCGLAIPLSRLMVQPAALRCAACQSAHEHTQSRAGA